MILVKFSDGWPSVIVSEAHAGNVPEGHRVFADRPALFAWMSANESQRPQDPPALEPVPPEVQAWKVKMVLRKRGQFAAVQAGIDALTGPNALMVQSRWEYGGTLPRDGDTVNELCLTALGYTPAQTDDLFREADRIPD